MRHFLQFVLLSIAAASLANGIAAQPAATQPALFSLTTSSDQPTISLNGSWRFHPGDNPSFAEPSYDDSSWPLLRSTTPWSQQGYESLTGFAWYRFRIVVRPGAHQESLLLPAISSGYQCFIDGKLARTEGAVPNQSPARYAQPATIDLPPPDQTQPQTHTIALRVWFDPHLAGSYAGGPDPQTAQLLSIGDSSVINARLAEYFAIRRQASTVLLAVSILFILAGIICFPLFLMERSHREYFWYSIAATSFGLTMGFAFDSLTHAWPISTFLLVIALCDLATSVGLVFFFSYLLRIKRNWLTALIILAIIAWDSSASLQNLELISDSTADLLVAIGQGLFAAWVVIAVARRASQRVLDAMLLVVPVTLDFGVLFVDGIRAKFPTFAQPIDTFASHTLLTYPFPVRVRDLLAAFVLLAFVSVLLNRFVRIRREHDRITADMRAARSVQHLLIPDVLPTVPGLNIQAAYHPAQEVGGDFFQVMPIASGKTLIVLGDVSGKGLPAAMTVSLIVGIIRTLVEFTTSPGAILAGLNTRLVGRGTGFTTCLAIEIASDGTLIFANAGQLAPYRNGIEIPSEAALPLGIIPDLVFPESTFQLAHGDRLTLMTDGIPEAASNTELFGFSRTEQLSQQSAEHIAAAAQQFGQTDDITVLSIDFQPTPS
jgi:phosphoserine phosphatase RsbU/P